MQPISPSKVTTYPNPTFTFALVANYPARSSDNKNRSSLLPTIITMRLIYVASLLFATVAVANPLSSLQERNVLVLRQFGCV
jgi:hypothetical protein